MRRLYFDIDGTLVLQSDGLPKPALAGGRFERAVRAAGVEELICVGRLADVIHMAASVDSDYDGAGLVFSTCADIFADEGWFRAALRLAADAANRAAEVDLSADWWYVDDDAESYFRHAGRVPVFRENVGGRICVPSPDGDGTDVLLWLESIPRP